MDAMDPLLSESNEAVLRFLLKGYERELFPDMKPLADLQVAVIDGPARFLPNERIIQINPSIATFQKLCRILILHELIHSKLFLRDNDPDESHGERFRAEVTRLWESDAYVNLL